MQASRATLLFILACLLLLAGCAQPVSPYSNNEIVRLEQGDPAPFSGWLLSDADVEMLVKRAEMAADNH